MLDLFEEAWTDSTGGVGERLAFAFEQARSRFNNQAPAIVPRDADFPDDLPAAVLLAVAAVDGTAHVVWIGGDIAVLARGFVATAVTTPHTLREQYSREHPDEAIDIEKIPNVLVRTIGPRAASQDPPAVAAFQLEAGDTLVLLSKANFRGPCVPASEAAFAAGACSSPVILAERLADLAFANEDSPYAATAVLRFDAVDVESEIERLIDRYEPDPRHGTWLRDWARLHCALPVSFDMGGVLGLKADGIVLSVAWDHWDHPNDSTREEASATAHLAATIGAARNYPALETLAPRRPATARACSHCPSLAQAQAPGCPMCWYLGWEVPRPPASFYALGAEPGVVAAEGRQVKEPAPWWRRIFGGRA
jgi:hypothetical protein